MRNKDRRYERYQHDPKFHNAVNMIEALIHNYNFTHQDIQDAAFVACMKHIEQNPIPLTSFPDISHQNECGLIACPKCNPGVLKSFNHESKGEK